MAPKAIEPDAKIPCTSLDQLQHELSQLETALAPEEREDTWEKMERAILRFAAITRGGAYKLGEPYIKALGPKANGPKLVACMLTERGRLSGVAVDFVSTMAPRLAHAFQPLVPLYVPALVRLSARPNKVYLRRAEKTLTTLITHCQCSNIIPCLLAGIEDKSDATRRTSSMGVEKVIDEWSRESIGVKGIVELEMAIRKMATDRDPDTRKAAKRAWEAFESKYPERVDDFTAPLTPTISKYLGIKGAGVAGPSKPVGRKPIMLHNQIAAKAMEKKIASASTQAPAPSSSSHASSTADAVRRVREAYAALPRSNSKPTSPHKPVVMNRSTSASSGASVNPAAQAPMLHQRSVSAAELPLHRSKTSAAISEALVASTSSNPHAQPARPRVLHHASTADVPFASTSGAAGGRQLAPGPFRPVRTASTLGYSAEGVMAAPSMTASTSRQGGPVRIRPALTNRASDKDVGPSAPLPKRLLPGGPAVRRPPPPPKEQQDEARTTEEDVGDAARAKNPRSPELRSTAASRSPTPKPSATNEAAGKATAAKIVLPPGSRIVRQPFKPKSSGKALDQPERVRAPLTAPTASTKARAQPKVAVASPDKTRKPPGSRISPVKHTTAKLVVSPRKPKVKLKAPLPSFAPAPKARAPAADVRTSTSTGVKVKTIGSLPKAEMAPGAEVAAAVPLPPSPAPRRQDERDQHEEMVDHEAAAKEESEAPTASPAKGPAGAAESSRSSSPVVPRRNTPSPTLLLPAITSDLSILAQQIPLPESPPSASDPLGNDVAQMARSAEEQVAASPAPRSKTSSVRSRGQKMELLNLSDDEDIQPRPPHSAPLLARPDLGIVSSPQRRLKVSKSLSSMRLMQSPVAANAAAGKENVPVSSPAPNASAFKVKRLSAFFEAKTGGTPERAMDAGDKGWTLSATPVAASPARRPKVLGNAGQL